MCDERSQDDESLWFLMQIATTNSTSNDKINYNAFIDNYSV